MTVQKERNHIYKTEIPPFMLVPQTVAKMVAWVVVLRIQLCNEMYIINYSKHLYLKIFYNLTLLTF